MILRLFLVFRHFDYIYVQTGTNASATFAVLDQLISWVKTGSLPVDKTSVN